MKRLLKDHPQVMKDDPLVMLLESAYEDYFKASDDISKHGHVNRDTGRAFINPACNVKNEAFKQIHRIIKTLQGSGKPDEMGGEEWSDVIPK